MVRHTCTYEHMQRGGKYSDDDVATCHNCNNFREHLDYALFKVKARSGLSPKTAADRLKGW